jgi:sugar phosphate isomerase/epimerase
MRPSLNGVIFGTGMSLEDQVRIAAEVGFEGVDTGIEAIAALIEERTLDGAREFFREAGVQPAVWGLTVDWRGPEDSYRASLEGLTHWAELACQIGCPRCCTWLPPSVEDAAATRRLAVRRFRESAQVLGDYGVRLGLEWVGPRTSRLLGQSFIYRMDQLLEMIDEIGQPNLGLLVDSFHWFTAGHTVEELAGVPRERIVHVHINDAPDRPRDEQIDMERLLPGEGIIDLAGFLSALRQVGYDDYLGVETFSDELRALPPAEAARRAKEAVDSVL